MTSPLESRLSHLAEPAPPATLAAGVMARVARTTDERAATPTRPAAARPAAGWPVLWLGLPGLLLVAGTGIYGALQSGSLFDVMSPRVGGLAQGLPVTLVEGPAGLLMTAGLLLYLTGLFAPLRGR